MPRPQLRGSFSRPFAPAGRLVPVLATALLAACSRGGGGGDSVTFALAGPMQMDLGASTRRGAELAVREVNAAGGIRGDSLRLVVHDDEAKAERAIAIAGELVANDSVAALAGPVTSGATIGSAEIYDGVLPVLATTATSPAISRLGDWIYRVASSDSANAVVLANTARRLSPVVAVLYANDAYGRGLAGAFSDALVKAGGSIPEADPYMEDMEDFTPYLRRLQQRGVQMVFIAGLDASSARIITQARQLGLQARFIGGDGMEPLKTLGPVSEGSLVGLLYHRDANPQARAFAEAYRAAYQQEADHFAAAGYDAVKLLATAAIANGASREGIQRYLHRLGQEGGPPPYAGATGTIRFDRNGDPLEKAFAVGVIQNGTIQLFGSDQ